METKVSFTIVGAFVLILSAAIIAGVLWLGSGKRYRAVYDRYDVYMTESVAGLNPNAPVRYRGVEVGAVREIALDPVSPERVRLMVEIVRGTPVREDSIAVLSSQGLTGIAYIDLTGGSRDAQPLRAKAGERYPVIRSEPSRISQLYSGATTLLARLEQSSVSMNALLDDENRQSIKRSLADIERITHMLAERQDVIDRGVVGAARTLENTAAVSAELAEVVGRIRDSADAVERMANEVARAGASARSAMESAERAVDLTSGELRDFGSQSLPELGRLVADTRELTASLTRIVERLETDPSMLIRGAPPLALGPGE